MAVVTLTFLGSDIEIASGIPKFMTISSNIPATIYFTLDGATPTINSPIYIDTFEMPDNTNTILVSAFGIDGVGDPGSILTQSFSPDVTSITVSRYTGQEGVAVDRYDDETDNVIGHDADGNPIAYTDYDDGFIGLRILRSDTGLYGMSEGTQIDVNVPDPSLTTTTSDDGFVPFSTPEIGELFNPEARVIFIDNRKDNDINIVLKPYGSLHNIYKEFGGKRLRESADDATYISGGQVRRFYDARNKVMVSYYFDHNESRWVRNIQDLPDNVGTTVYADNSQHPLIFPWVSPGTQTGTNV